MKFKILLITITLFTISTSLFAAAPIDSVGVKNNDGKKMVLFKVKAKDTYYSIARRYGIKPEALMKFNGSKKTTLTIGAIVEVPTEMPFKKSSKESSEKSAKETKKEKAARLEREEDEANAEKKKKHKAAERSEETTTSEQSQPAPVKVIAQQPVQQTQPQVQSTVQPQVEQQDSTPLTQYKVSSGETLYSISKRFGTTVDDITRLNNLSSTNLAPGQVLLIRSGVQTPPPAPSAPPVTYNTPTVAIRDSTNPASIGKDSADRHLNANKFGLYEKNEKGVATWIDDPSLDPNKKLVLHRTAPIGTVIKITNPMTNRTTFAKVVGTFADNADTKDVIIVMTKNVANSLGALDKRFHVTISYGSPNE
jgi:LysM repeat protein